MSTLTATRLDPPLGLRPGQTALAVAAHPDDETLGPGGTLHRLAASGIVVTVLTVACDTGPMGDGHSDPGLREKELQAACAALGVADHVLAWTDGDHARQPGNHMADLVALIESGTAVSLTNTRPDLLLIPAAGGHHQDHDAVHRAALAAARLGDSKPTPPIVLGYRGPEDHWTPAAAAGTWTVRLDTSDHWDAKRQALLAHASQLRQPPHPRSVHAVHALDTAAGTTAGTTLAEAFVPYRITR